MSDDTPERVLVDAMADMWESKAELHKWQRFARELSMQLGMSQAQYDHELERFGIEVK